MYKHQIDECIERAQKDLAVARRYWGSKEYAEHAQRRIDSLRRIREKAPTANIGAKL